jgi:hypothetical protein
MPSCSIGKEQGNRSLRREAVAARRGEAAIALPNGGRYGSLFNQENT